MNQVELERSIDDARTRGDTGTLERLQAEYRRLPAIRVIGPESVRVTGSPPGPLAEDRAREVLAARAERASATVPTVVRVTPGARRELQEVRFDSSYEHGGYTLGYVDGPELIIETLRGGNGNDTQGEPHAVHMNRDYGLMLEERTGLRLCGLWHSHPRTPPDEELRLSSYDEDSIARWAQAGKETIVSLLLGPGDPDRYHVVWAYPRMKAWLAHEDGSVREAALLLEEANT
jgi:hypothetical protein